MSETLAACRYQPVARRRSYRGITVQVQVPWEKGPCILKLPPTDTEVTPETPTPGPGELVKGKIARLLYDGCGDFTGLSPSSQARKMLRTSLAYNTQRYPQLLLLERKRPAVPRPLHTANQRLTSSSSAITDGIRTTETSYKQGSDTMEINQRIFDEYADEFGPEKVIHIYGVISSRLRSNTGMEVRKRLFLR